MTQLLQKTKFYIIYISFVLLSVVDAARKKRRGALTQRKRKHSMSQFVYVMIIAALCVVVPIITYFIYSVVRDPMTPVVLKQLWQHVNERWTGYLGSKKKTSSKKSKKDED